MSSTTKLSTKEWCTCKDWKFYHTYMRNLKRMKFCPFCGSKLVKKEVEKPEVWETS